MSRAVRTRKSARKSREEAKAPENTPVSTITSAQSPCEDPLITSTSPANTTESLVPSASKSPRKSPSPAKAGQRKFPFSDFFFKKKKGTDYGVAAPRWGTASWKKFIGTITTVTHEHVKRLYALSATAFDEEVRKLAYSNPFDNHGGSNPSLITMEASVFATMSRAAKFAGGGNEKTLAKKVDDLLPHLDTLAAVMHNHLSMPHRHLHDKEIESLKSQIVQREAELHEAEEEIGSLEDKLAAIKSLHSSEFQLAKVTYQQDLDERQRHIDKALGKISEMEAQQKQSEKRYTEKVAALKESLSTLQMALDAKIKKPRAKRRGNNSPGSSPPPEEPVTKKSKPQVPLQLIDEPLDVADMDVAERKLAAERNKKPTPLNERTGRKPREVSLYVPGSNPVFETESKRIQELTKGGQLNAGEYIMEILQRNKGEGSRSASEERLPAAQPTGADNHNNVPGDSPVVEERSRQPSAEKTLSRWGDATMDGRRR